MSHKYAPRERCPNSSREAWNSMEKVEGGRHRCSCGAEVKLYRRGYGYQRYVPVHNRPRETLASRDRRHALRRMRAKVASLGDRFQGTEVGELVRVTAMVAARELAGITVVEFVTRQEARRPDPT